MPLASGATLGAYQIVGPLGAGGMGEVYRARDARLERDVALKILPPDMAGDPTRLERFGREARAIAALNHPHIVTIYSTEEADGVRFLTMELVEGQTLDAVLAAGVPTVARFLDLALPLADALTAAHQKQITHRDLKPGNVMVSADGRVKVLDFGLARVGVDGPDQAVDATRAALTSEGTIVGTIPYMSPEQVEGRPLDPRSDLFSLGVMFFEMLTGARPFQGASSPALMSAILRDTPPLTSDVRADVPEALARLVARCLEKRPDNRVQTARDVYNELRQVQKQLESGSARRPDSGPVPPASIAVLPFTDLSEKKDQEWFCDGIAEEILNALTGLPGLRVAARTSAFSFRGREADLRAIADALGVHTVLQGSLRRAGDRVRITVQLVDTRSGFQLWSERHDREMADIFDVQDEIARGVAERLKVTLDSGIDHRVARRTRNIEAYELYLKGRGLLNQRGAGLLPALEAFRQSVELDPDFALAWAGIADAYTVLAYLGALPVEQMRGRCLAAAARAVALAPESAETHSAVACAALLYRADRDQAGRSFQQALALNPAYVQGRVWYAVFYLQWTLGRMDEGILEARKAVETDPLSSHAHVMLSITLYTAGRYAEAVEESRRALTLDPSSFPPHWILADSLGRLGQFDEAFTVIDRGAAVSNRHPLILLSLSQVLAAKGRSADADAVYRELLERAQTTHVNDGQLAAFAWYAGHQDDAVAYARRALATREPLFLLVARYTPIYRDMQADPRIEAIVGELDALPPAPDA